MAGEFKQNEDLDIVSDESIQINEDMPVSALQATTSGSIESRPKEPKPKRPSDRSGRYKLVKLKKRTDADLTPPGSLYPRNWGGAMLAFATAIIYQLLVIKLFQVIHGGGIESWIEVIKFNFSQIAALIAVGPAHQIEAPWLNAILILYWSLFLIYPIAIFGFPAHGRIFSRRQTFKGKLGQSLAVLFGLAVLIPLPCIRLWWLSKSDQKQLDEKIDSMPDLQLFPEVLAVLSELVLWSAIAHRLLIHFTQLLIHLTLGQTYFRWETLHHHWWTIPVGQVFLAAIVLYMYRKRRIWKRIISMLTANVKSKASM